MNIRTLRDIATIDDPLERARTLGRAMAESQGLVEEAARMRRQAIAEARAAGHRLDEIARALGVSPGRISQMRNGPAARAPEPRSDRAPQVIVRRRLPTDSDAHGPCFFVTAIERQGFRADLRILTIGHESASDHVAACLRIPAGEDVIVRRRLMLADDVPVRIATSYFRADLFGSAGFDEPDVIEPSMQHTIEGLGHTFGHAEETLLARPAGRLEAEHLHLEFGDWVIQVLRASYSTDATPVRVMETICAASRHVFTIDQVAGLTRF